MTDPIDAHVGKRIREYRRALKLSQRGLGSAIGVSPQQVCKYEIGGDRVSAATLWRIAEAVGVSVGWFFEGIG